MIWNFLIFVQVELSIYSHILSFFFVNYEGTMNWARMIHLMLPSSMTVVGLKTLKLLAAQPIFMSLMTKTDVISHLTISIGQFTIIVVSFLPLYMFPDSSSAPCFVMHKLSLMIRFS